MVPLFPVMIVRRDWVRVLLGGLCWVVGSGMLMGTDVWYGYGWKFKSSILFGVSEISRCEKELLEN